MARIRWNNHQIILTAQRFTVPLVRRVGQEVLIGARHLAPRGSHLSGSGKAKTGEPLSPSIHMNMTVNTIRVSSVVGSRVSHAATVHQGSKAHIIRSKGGKMLKFRWDRGDFLVAARAGRRRGNRRTGQFHYFMRVRHPGNKHPVRYLTIPLAMFGRINGFRVSTTAVNRTRLP